MCYELLTVLGFKSHYISDASKSSISGSKRRHEDDYNDGYSRKKKRTRNYVESDDSDVEVIESDSDSELESMYKNWKSPNPKIIRTFCYFKK